MAGDHPLETLLGASLVTKGGAETSTAAALKGKKAVGLYFSAHWCPPCRGFTPQLAKQYEKLLSLGKEFEVVFVSSDKNEEEFKSYHAEQPWLALPYADREKKAALSKKFKVSGIPTLIILNGETGEIITKDGRSAVMEDSDGKAFPWEPPSIWDALGTEFLKGGDGETVEIDELRGPGKTIGIYFSAHWCPPCKGFTPQLVKTYNALKAAGKEFEIIFASSDRSMAEFTSYFSEMPWCAIPMGDKRKEQLSKRFGVEGIPTFVMIDADTGATITTSGRAAVGLDPEGKEYPWHPRPVGDLASPDGINEETCVCVLADGCSAEAQQKALDELTPLAEASKAKGEDLLFFIAKNGDGAVGQVRKLTGLSEAKTTPQLLILDIPDQGGYYVAEDGMSVSDFVAAYKKGELKDKRKQLS